MDYNIQEIDENTFYDEDNKPYKEFIWTKDDAE